MTMLVPLNLPHYPLKIRKNNQNQLEVFDEIRGKYLKITPEEWVRVNFIQWLVNEKKYSKSLIQVEKELTINTLKKRTDILVFNNKGEKIILVECKAPTVKISQKTFDQIAIYNMAHHVPYLIVTNGLEHCFFSIDSENKTYSFLNEIPAQATV